jgi:hypothetical protein
VACAAGPKCPWIPFASIMGGVPSSPVAAPVPAPAPVRAPTQVSSCPTGYDLNGALCLAPCPSGQRVSPSSVLSCERSITTFGVTSWILAGVRNTIAPTITFV